MDDLYFINLVEMRWEKPETMGIRPMGREGFGLLEIRGN
jgi:hypothetical protein